MVGFGSVEKFQKNVHNYCDRSLISDHDCQQTKYKDTS